MPTSSPRFFSTSFPGLRSVLVLALLWPVVSAQAQNCTQPAFAPSSTTGVIDWEKFPDFSLPFTLVYSGPRLDDTERLPLRHGFSHLGSFAGNDASALPARQRALIWYGLAFGTNQPWSLLESPFANDLAVFREKWRGELRNLANAFDDSRGRDAPNVDLLVPDIERDIATDRSILSLKTNAAIPAPIRQLDDAAFLQRYQREMQKLYAEPLKFAQQSGFLGKQGTYGDAPVRLTEFLNVDANSWQDWSTNPARLNYLLRDSLTNSVGGPFAERLSVVMPSAYFCYDYPSSLAGNYLSFMLFQVEANRARSTKDVVLFEWLRYIGDCGSGNRFIKPWMAEASAIFPFFSGAKGIWLWEDPTKFGQIAGENLAVYEHFVQGLYRLSQFKEFFDSDPTLYIPKPARDHFADRDPVWRGVLKGNRILIAAQNPYADDGRTTTLPIRYGTWETTLTLKGTEILLCVYDLPDGMASAQNLSLYPNPATAQVTARYTSALPIDATLQLFDATGKLLREEYFHNRQGGDTISYPISLNGLPAGLYTVRVSDGGIVFSKKLVVR